jgi:hypothetical protein
VPAIIADRGDAAPDRCLEIFDATVSNVGATISPRARKSRITTPTS